MNAWGLVADPLIAAKRAECHSRTTICSCYGFSSKFIHISVAAMMLPDEVKKDAQACLLECKRDGGKLVSSVSAIIELLQKHQLAWKQRIHASQVGVHPHNRDGVGVSVSETHSLIQDVLGVGFSKEEASRSVCIEIGAKDSVMIQQFNERLSAQSNGKLATLQPHGMRYASVAGSHLNAGLNCWLQGCSHDGSVGTADGKLSMARLKEIDQAYHDAVCEGLEWTVIASSAAEAYPELAVMIQSAMNVGAHLSYRIGAPIVA